MDINAVIQERLNNINLEEILQKSLEEQVKRTFERVLDDAYGSYSPFSKKLKELVEQQMIGGLDKLTIPQYTEFILDKVHEVLKDQMTEERAEKIKASFATRLSPHLEREVEQEDLIQAIIEGLEESVKENWQSQEYVIRVAEDRASVFGSKYWSLTVFDGEADRNNKVAVLHFNNEGKCYHHNGERNDPLTKRFASYALNRTKILNVEEYEKTINSEYFI